MEKQNFEAETPDNLEEPNFHKRNETLCMKLFPYLAARTKLTFEEIAYFYGIKNIVTKPYDASDPEHEVNLKDTLYNKFINTYVPHFRKICGNCIFWYLEKKS